MIRFLASAMTSFRAPLKFTTLGLPQTLSRKRDQQTHSFPTCSPPSTIGLWVPPPVEEVKNASRWNRPTLGFDRIKATA